jgi:NAD(P)-dependent dehydrogenase (short-subunit alcohol dehydrogenase family)
MVIETPKGTMQGRTVLVTGATDGIGLHTARSLASLGAHVIITGRTEARGLAAAALIDADTGHRSATFIQADHATIGGNRHLADRVRADFAGLDVLVNNVGGLYDTRRETAEGYEATLAMNFLGPFALTAQLLPALRERAPARCVFVVSAGFKMYRRDPFHDVQSTRDYVAADAYNRAKLLNLLAGLALAERLAADRITVNAVHPGLAWTRMTRSMTPRTMPLFRHVWPIVRLAQRHGSPQKAGRRVAHLACSAHLAGHTGGYFERGPAAKKLSPRELNLDTQQRAWRLAADLIAAVEPQVVDGG